MDRPIAARLKFAGSSPHVVFLENARCWRIGHPYFLILPRRTNRHTSFNIFSAGTAR
jgi:hypothetical protein